MELYGVMKHVLLLFENKKDSTMQSQVKISPIKIHRLL